MSKEAKSAATPSPTTDPVFASAAKANAPLRTLEELIRAGGDPKKEHCCAVPEDGRIRGCGKGAICARAGFGREGFVPGHPAWGPKHAVAGATGSGPEYVTWYQRTAEGHESEHATLCWQFMGDPFDRMQEMHRTGEKIVVLGGPGEPYVEIQQNTVWNPRTKQNELEVETVEKVCPTLRDGKPKAGRESFVEKRAEMAERRRRGRDFDDTAEYAGSETRGSEAGERVRAKASAKPAEDE